MTDTETIADVIVKGIKAAMAPRDARIGALESAIAALLARGHQQDQRLLELEAQIASTSKVSR
jgi:hypothetical protein